MTDFAGLYFSLVVASMCVLCYAWWQDRKRKKKPNLKVIEGGKDAKTR